MRKHTIYIEGLALVEGHFSGIGQYTLGVLRGLDALIEENKLAGKPSAKVTVVIPYDTRSKFNSFEFKHIGYKRVPFSFRLMSALWHRYKMPPLDLFCGRGTYVFTRFVDMPLLFSKSCVVIYDLSYELFRQHSNERNSLFLSKYVKKSIANASRVITISKNAKHEIIDFYHYEQSKIAVAYPAADQQYFYRRSTEEIEEVKYRYGIKGNYILALSNLEPRKNLDALVDAYCNLPKSITKEVGLLLVGINGWKTEKLFDKITDKVDEGFNILRPSHYVRDKDRPAIISGAKILVYPSHYEGFGMPPLEALACGVPVIAADNSSLPEAVGDAGILVKSNDLNLLTNKIKEGLENYQSWSDEARISGPKQAQNFSWASSAQVILDVVDEVNAG